MRKLILAVLLFASPAFAQAPESAKQEAREHFDRGVELFDEEAWDAALVEFQQSRVLFPTKNATKNAAVCLRMLHRYDEAMEMFETLLRDFPDLSADARAFGEKELKALSGMVGHVELRGGETGATIAVDSRTRGSLPSAPVRVSVGTHVIRVIKDGFMPFESEIQITGGQTLALDVKMMPLQQSGKLRVVEGSGKVANVRVDSIVVGKTPWEGTLAIGDHTVSLEGDGDLGTQPARAPITLGQLTPLTLSLETLDAKLRVEPDPNVANVAIDGVVVGRGPWDGKLRSGPHKIEIASEGYLPATKDITLTKGGRLVVAMPLERDPTASLTFKEAQAARQAWLDRRGSTFTFEVRGHGNVLLLPHTDEYSGYLVGTTINGTESPPADNRKPNSWWGGGGAGGVGVRLAYLFLALPDPAKGSNWHGFRVGTGIDVNYGYYFWKGRVDTVTIRDEQPSPMFHRIDKETHTEAGAWGGGFIVNVPLTIGYQLGLGSFHGNDWKGWALGVAYTPTWTIYKHSKFPAHGEMNLAGIELSVDFLDKPMESKAKVAHAKVFFYALPPYAGKPTLLSIGGGAAWY